MKTYFLAVIGIVSTLNMYAQATPVTKSEAQQRAQSFKEIIESNNNYIVGGEGSPLVSIKVSEGTIGSPYLLTNWATGKVILQTGAIHLESTSSLNFDKIKQVLVLKKTATTVFEVDMKTVKSFELADPLGTQKFVTLDVKPAQQAIELYADSLYGLYKTIRTEFVKSDYVNRGIYESGDKYDRYVDQVVYYIRGKSGQLSKLENVTGKKIKQLDGEIPGIADALKSGTESMENKDAFMMELIRNLAKTK